MDAVRPDFKGALIVGRDLMEIRTAPCRPDVI
jgi:hypothetical protein